MKFQKIGRYLFPLCLAGAVLAEQYPVEAARSHSVGLDLLVQKARSLEARDRADLAAQVWQQVLVTMPNQPEALAGLARWSKRSGKNEEANSYLSRLRRVAPDASALTQIDAADSISKASGRLREAQKLSVAGHPEDAMRIYREVFGAAPPPGGWAVAYYETLANTAGGFEPAVRALQRLASSYPDVPIYRLAAGRLMTYKPATRQTGIALLSSISGSTAAAAKAREAWRQALVWEKSNPAYTGALAVYLSKSERVSPETREEQLGYAALKAGALADAERQFTAALTKDERNSRAQQGSGSFT
jgi:tetratricopeptide (TPR) repeat protein